MKLTVVVVLAVVVVAGLFVLGLIWPRHSRQAQEKLKDTSAKGERHSVERAGRIGDRTAEVIDLGRRLSERAAHAGRVAHDRVTRSRRGQAQERHLDEKYGEGGRRGEGPRDSELGR